MKVKIISGANLNVLEKRGAEYGGMTYDALKAELAQYAVRLGIDVEFFVSNHEGALIDEIQNLDADALIINAGGYSHYSVAIADALATLAAPKIEVHLTNIHRRDRHVSVTGAAADGVICGLGADGYKIALEYLAKSKQSNNKPEQKTVKNEAVMSKQKTNKYALIGMMGTGKTACGMKLAEKLGFSFADTDDIIVWRLGMPIMQVFITFGEERFRSMENSVLCELVWQDDMVISCGGGLILSAENRKLLEGFTKIRLTAEPETIYGRIKDDFSRPLIQDNSPVSLAKIMKERESLYGEVADITVATDGKTTDEVVEEIIAGLRKAGL